MSTTNGGPARSRPASAPAAAAHGPGAIHQGSLVRESECAAARSSQNVQPQINISVNVAASPLTDTDFEVELRLEGKAEAAGSVMFNVELVFAGVFRIQNMPQEQLQPVLLIECPRLLFPFAREIIATSVRNGGFPPLLLDPIDFVRALSAAHGTDRARPAHRTWRKVRNLRRRRPVSRIVRPILPPDRILARALRRTRDARHAPRR